VGETTGFLKWGRSGPTRRPVELRLKDWKEVYEPFDGEILKSQAGRCMDCGIPFCKPRTTFLNSQDVCAPHHVNQRACLELTKTP
jgi:formylmethanofuran dehydrogenase subunit E